jgi:DNA invertase Pin-like site-specific DNA recombinase
MLIGYARVSTEDQDTALQRDALIGAGCERIFEETASGARIDREQLRAAIEFARMGDSVVVWKLDRLARSLTQLIQTIEELEKNGVGFRSLTESIDTTTAGGRLIFHIFGALAEFERAIIRERTRAGLLAARNRGRKGGRRPSLSETDMGAARALLASPVLSFGEVAKRMRVSKGTLYRYFPGGRGAPASPSTLGGGAHGLNTKSGGS